MIPDFIKQFMGEHIERIAPNDFEKTKLAHKYNQDMKPYEELMEIVEGDLEKWREIDEIRRGYIDRMEKLLGVKEAEKRTKK